MTASSRKPPLSKRARDLERGVKEAVRLALLDHKRAGNPNAIWRDGKVVILPPGQIPDHRS